MKNLLLAAIGTLVLLSCSPAEKNTAVIAIVPKPVSIVPGNDALILKEVINIGAGTTDEKSVAILLKEFLALKKINSSIVSDKSDSQFLFHTTSDSLLGNEGYRLTIKENILIEANSGAGFFYGLQTFIQLFPPDAEGGATLPTLEIVDYPRFQYRGLHLDVGRHMFPVDFIKKYIDLLARHKMNRFHWHLTEDQGWRIEIKKYPKLQEISAYRKETAVGFASSRKPPASYDHTPYGGFYSQEEIKEVVNYASTRFVTIIPEIEMPGHALAALAAYPGLGCTGGPYETAKTWGVFKDVFCAGKEETFTFLEGVLDEVVELFPGQSIHIGGDECPKVRWETCPACQNRMKKEGLKDEHELQSYFIQRIEKYINSKGKQIIGWDEILEGGLAQNATVMSWRGEEGGIAAAKQGHDVIMTPTQWCYLDYYQDTSKTEPLAIEGFIPVSKIYSYEPVPPQLNAEEAQHILGAQCNAWSEYFTTPEHVEYMVYPRAIAMAEVVWSPKENRNFEEFTKRMEHHRKLLDSWNVNYAKHLFNQEIKK